MKENSQGHKDNSGLKDGPVSRVLKEIRMEALKHLSLAFRESERLVSWTPLPGHSRLGTFLCKKILFDRCHSMNNVGFKIFGSADVKRSQMCSTILLDLKDTDNAINKTPQGTFVA